MSIHRLARCTPLLLALLSAPVQAQSTAAASPGDSIYRRARRLVSEGNGAAGRALVDSLLKQATEGSSTYGDALYWRGALAETAAEAERDYRRVIVEYPVSAYADDALLALAQLEQARGDRASAQQHYQRFVREHPASPVRGIAALAAIRLAFEQRDTKAGCAMVADARASVPSTDIETRNQIDYYGKNCSAADLSAATQIAAAPAVPARDTSMSAATPARSTAATRQRTAPTPAAPPPRAVEKPAAKPIETAPASVAPPARHVEKPAAKPVETAPAKQPEPVVEKAPEKAPEPAPKPAPRGIYTIQLAAYNTLPDAEQLVKKLKTRDVAARVSGTSKPFRVRLDFYPTHQAAQDEVARLKQRGIIGFVTTEEPPRETKTP